MALAVGGARVLLIDADMRRPSVHKALRMTNDRGLSQLLAGQARMREVVQRTHDPNLLTITAGRTPANPSELLASDRMRALLAGLETGPFDWIIIDTPPVLAVTDAVILAPLGRRGDVRHRRRDDALAPGRARGGNAARQQPAPACSRCSTRSTSAATSTTTRATTATSTRTTTRNPPRPDPCSVRCSSLLVAVSYLLFAGGPPWTLVPLLALAAAAALLDTAPHLRASLGPWRSLDLALVALLVGDRRAAHSAAGVASSACCRRIAHEIATAIRFARFGEPAPSWSTLSVDPGATLVALGTVALGVLTLLDRARARSAPAAARDRSAARSTFLGALAAVDGGDPEGRRAAQRAAS